MVEVSETFEAAGETDSRNTEIRFCKATFGFRHSKRLDVFGESHPRFFVKQG
jgi:hypothetical protein